MPKLTSEDIKYKNEFIETYSKNMFSQNGEDGIMKELLKRLEIDNGWVCEFGAADGLSNSNTFSLVKKDFNAVYIEADPELADDLKDLSEIYPNITAIHKKVDHNPTENCIDNILKETNIPIDFDILSIDIDSYDYQVWESMKIYKPKIIIIEINSGVNPTNINYVHDGDKYQGTGFCPMYNLGLIKGYKFIGHTENMIFIKKELFDKLKLPSVNNPLENFKRLWWRPSQPLFKHISIPTESYYH